MTKLNIQIIGSDELSIFNAVFEYIDEKKNSNQNWLLKIKTIFYDPISKNNGLIRKRICLFKKYNQYKIIKIPSLIPVYSKIIYNINSIILIYLKICIKLKEINYD